MGGDHIGLLSNLAMGYLWSGHYNDAFEIYSKFKGEKELRLNRKSGKEIFLDDIKAVENEGVKPLRDEDVQKIKDYLNK